MNIVITNNNMKGKIPKFDCDGNHGLLVLENLVTNYIVYKID